MRKAPKYIFGKPDLGMVEPLITEHKLVVRKTLIVGDRLHTDIQLSKLIDCYGMLVLSGETTRDQLETSKIQPDFVLNTISEV
jgi:ribonucleotide monophosphatase NagD (HAD superfamily)